MKLSIEQYHSYLEKVREQYPQDPDWYERNYLIGLSHLLLNQPALADVKVEDILKEVNRG